MEKIRLLITSHAFIIAFVLGVYLFTLWLYKKTRLSLLHPVWLSIVLIISFLSIFKIDFPVFQEGSRLIDFMLGPCVVALGYQLYEQVQHIRKNWWSMFASLTIGSFIGIVSVSLIARWMGANEIIISSLEPKSVTTPIAIGISSQLGGLPSLTAVVVVAVGIFGSVVGPLVLNILGIDSKIARGLALGAASHGIGTARALEMGAIEGAISGLAIGLMGIITALWIPIIHWIV